MRKAAKQINMTQGTIWKQMLLFFFPVLFGFFFQQLYNTADAVIVGQFVGKEALSAVGGSPARLLEVLVGFFVGLASGATVVVSQFYGGGEAEQMRKSVHTAITISVVLGAIQMVLTFAVAPWSIRMMNTPEDVLADSVLYLQIYSLGMIPSLVYNIGSGILRAVGDAKRPLYFLIASCILNIVLDVLFVAVIPWGVFGVALATILSQFASAGMVIVVLFRAKNEDYGLRLKEIGIDWTQLRKIFRIGFPAGIQAIMYGISNIIIMSYVNMLGTDTVAGYTAYGKIDTFFWMVINASGITVATFVGQNFGSGDYARMRRGTNLGLAATMAVIVAMSAAVCLVGRNVFYLFIQDEAVIDAGVEILYFIIPTFFTYVCIEIFASALRGIGDAVVPMWITGVGICGVRLLWNFLAVPHFMTMKTIMFSYPLTWILTSIVFIVYYRIKTKPLYTGVGAR